MTVYLVAFLGSLTTGLINWEHIARFVNLYAYMQIPYQQNKSTLVQRIAELVEDKVT
jgi:hypothetical protein